MEPSPFVEARRREARLLAIQSAPDSMSSVSGAVVRSARTRAPAALPGRMPAGGALIKMESPGGKAQKLPGFDEGSGKPPAPASPPRAPTPPPTTEEHHP